MRKVIGHHVTSAPNLIVVEAAEDPNSCVERLKDWNAKAAPIIKVMLICPFSVGVRPGSVLGYDPLPHSISTAAIAVLSDPPTLHRCLQEYLGEVMVSSDKIGDPITIALGTSTFDGAALNALLTKRFETEGVEIVAPVDTSAALKAKFDGNSDFIGSEPSVDKAEFFAAVQADEELVKILADGGFGMDEDAISKIDTSGPDGRMQWTELEGAVLKARDTASVLRAASAPGWGAEKVAFRFDETGTVEVPCLEVSKATVVAFDVDADADEYLKHTALIVVDVQNDFISGSLKVGNDPEAVVSAINNLRAQVAFGLVAQTQDSHPADHVSFVDNHEGAEAFSHVQVPAPDDSGTTMDQVMWPRHCVQESEGWKFHPDLEIPETDHIQAKGTNSKVDSYSGFFDNFQGSSTGLEDVLRDQHITDVFVVGLAYDYCAGLTACDAAHLGFHTYLVKDCTRAVSSDTEAHMDESLSAAGVEIILAAEVLEAATHGYRKSKAAATKNGRDSLYTDEDREKSKTRHSQHKQDVDLQLVASKVATGPQPGFEIAAEAGDGEVIEKDDGPKKPTRRASFKELKESREQETADQAAAAAVEAAAAAEAAAKAKAEADAAAAEAAKDSVMSASAQEHQNKFKERRASFNAPKSRRKSQE